MRGCKRVAAVLTSVALLGACSGMAFAQQWKALGVGVARSMEIHASSTVSVPSAIARRGGQVRLLLVGGGQGGGASPSACSDGAVQGGPGGDGGEVVEVDVRFEPGQCPSGLRVEIGAGGRGALQPGGVGIAGAVGSPTSVYCDDVLLAVAKGGSGLLEAMSGSRSSKGGRGAVVFNAVNTVAQTSVLQRAMTVKAAQDGAMGLSGYGSGGGGGGVSLGVYGHTVDAAGEATGKVLLTFNAPLGKGGYGAGNGAGPADYAAGAQVLPAESARNWGAGGGGGSLRCVAGVVYGSLAGGSGSSGFVRLAWVE